MAELFLPIPGYSMYEASNLGNIKSLYTGIILKPCLTRNRYHVSLGGKYMFVSRCVAMAHLPNPYDLPAVDHIDRNSSNNNVNNLRWISHQHNNYNKTGKGYCYVPIKKKFIAYIYADYKRIHLGYFNTELEAKNAYSIAKQKYHVIKPKIKLTIIPKPVP